MAFNNSDQGYHSLPSSLSSSPIQPTSSGALSSEKMPLYHRDVIYNSQPSSSTPSPTSSNEQFHFVQAVLPPPQNYQFYDNLIIEPESRNYSNKRRYVRNAVPRCVTNNNRPSNANGMYLFFLYLFFSYLLLFQKNIKIHLFSLHSIFFGNNLK